AATASHASRPGSRRRHRKSGQREESVRAEARKIADRLRSISDTGLQIRRPPVIQAQGADLLVCQLLAEAGINAARRAAEAATRAEYPDQGIGRGFSELFAMYVADRARYCNALHEDRAPACGDRGPVNPDRKSRQWRTQSVRLRIAAESAVAGLSASIGLNPASAV